MSKVFEIEALSLALRLGSIEYFEIIDPWTQEGTKNRLRIHMRSGEQIVLGEPSVSDSETWDAKTVYDQLKQAMEQE